MPNKQRQRLIINVVSNYGTFVLYSAVNFFLVGYIVRKLGKEAFGIVTLAMSLTVLAELLGEGISISLTKHLSADVLQGKLSRGNEYINTSLVWFSFYSIVAFVFCLVFANHVTALFDVPPRLADDARMAMRLMGFRMLLCFPFNTFQGVLAAYQRYDLLNLSKSASLILRILAVVVLFESFHAGISFFVTIIIATLVIERLMWLGFSLKITAGSLRLGISFVSRYALIGLLGFGSMILIISIANLMGYEAVKWIVGLELTVTDVGAYGLIATMASVTGNLARSISKVLMPVASKYDSLKQHGLNAYLGLLSTKYAMIVSAAFCLVPLLLIKPLLVLWVGEKYDAGYLAELADTGRVLLLGQAFITTTICLLQILNGIGRVKLPAIITIFWALGGLTSVWLYLRFFEQSLFAAVVVITIARVIGTSLHLIYGLIILKISFRKFVLDSVLRPVTIGLAVCLGSYPLCKYLDIYKPLNFIFIVAILGVAYLLLSWAVTLTRSERSILIEEIQPLLSKIGLASHQPNGG